jgi:hypothetical protein
MVHLPDRGVLFVGDVLMPYFGAPFVAEGSVEALFDTIAAIRSLHPTLLVHGHIPLSETFTLAVLDPLEAALRAVHDDATAALREGRALAEILQHNLLPPVLASRPAAVLPFLLMRDNLIERLEQQRTGYWKADGEGMEVFSRQEWAGALGLLADGREEPFVRAANSLWQRGDHGLALRMAELGLAAHPGSQPLTAARRRALDGLRARYQFNPFKFIIYSEVAGIELPPVEVREGPRAALRTER